MTLAQTREELTRIREQLRHEQQVTEELRCVVKELERRKKELEAQLRADGQVGEASADLPEMDARSIAEKLVDVLKGWPDAEMTGEIGGCRGISVQLLFTAEGERAAVRLIGKKAGGSA